MTRKHYEAIARAIADHEPDARAAEHKLWRTIRNEIAYAIASVAGEAFDVDKFIGACNVYSA